MQFLYGKCSKPVTIKYLLSGYVTKQLGTYPCHGKSACTRDIPVFERSLSFCLFLYLQYNANNAQISFEQPTSIDLRAATVYPSKSYSDICFLVKMSPSAGSLKTLAHWLFEGCPIGNVIAANVQHFFVNHFKKTKLHKNSENNINQMII